MSAELIVFGEFFRDLIFYRLPALPSMGKEVKTAHFTELPGGGVATTALIAARLGTPTAVVTRVGEDARQRRAWMRIEQSGICTVSCEFSKRFPTAITVCAAYNNERMMITHDPINRELHLLLKRHAVKQQLSRARHVHLACTPAPIELWASKLGALRSLGLTVSTDLGWNPEVLQSAKLPLLLKHCEFTFPNEVEAKAMTRENSVEKAARRLCKWVQTPVIKLGQEGCLAMRRGELLRVKSIRVKSVDPTGAGDAFNGGFLHGYLSNWPLEDCLRAGNVCGAMATTSAGGSSAIPSRAKLLQMMKRI
jgi:ribokinase